MSYSQLEVCLHKETCLKPINIVSNMYTIQQNTLLGSGIAGLCAHGYLRCCWTPNACLQAPVVKTTQMAATLCFPLT